MPRNVALTRSGVASGASPSIRTGATITRAPPLPPGDSTSVTQPVIRAGSAMAGATGAATRSLLSLALAAPSEKKASSISGHVTARPTGMRRIASHNPVATAAVSTSGHAAGSDFSMK